MNTTIKTALTFTFTLAAVLLLLFLGEVMTGESPKIGHGSMGNISRM